MTNRSSQKVAFEWRKPKLTAYRAASPRPLAFHLNRYPGIIIGTAVQVGARVFSLTWGAPGRIVESEASR